MHTTKRQKERGHCWVFVRCVCVLVCSAPLSLSFFNGNHLSIGLSSEQFISITPHGRRTRSRWMSQWLATEFRFWDVLRIQDRDGLDIAVASISVLRYLCIWLYVWIQYPTPSFIYLIYTHSLIAPRYDLFWFRLAYASHGLAIDLPYIYIYLLSHTFCRLSPTTPLMTFNSSMDRTFRRQRNQVVVVVKHFANT